MSATVRRKASRLNRARDCNAPLLLVPLLLVQWAVESSRDGPLAIAANASERRFLAAKFARAHSLCEQLQMFDVAPRDRFPTIPFSSGCFNRTKSTCIIATTLFINNQSRDVIGIQEEHIYQQTPLRVLIITPIAYL